MYETNVASCRIWDALGFKRIGRVKGCGNLRSHPDELIDAIIYGRDLGPEGEDFVSEERFDKIRFYLKHGKYPNGADRAEKSRLRSAATHYKLAPPEDGTDIERLMLKDKEVVSDPQRQYEIARQVHAQTHGGINKTTATIAEKYHWVRIKETVSLVIKNCPDCKETAKVPAVKPENTPRKSNGSGPSQNPSGGIERLVSFDEPGASQLNTVGSNRRPSSARSSDAQLYPQASVRAPVAPMHGIQNYSDMPLDPQIMEGVHHTSLPYPQIADSSANFGLDMVHSIPGDTRLATNEHFHPHDQTMRYQSRNGPTETTPGVNNKTITFEDDANVTLDQDNNLKHQLLVAFVPESGSDDVQYRN